jgi:hypothetical protein
MLDELSVVIAAIALAVSVIVFIDSRFREARAARLARRPALVFSWDGDTLRWTVSNIGSGPALDVVILQRIDGSWQHPLRMPEMAVDAANTVPRRWYEAWHDNPGLGARYRSVTDEEYATMTADDRSEIVSGWGELSPGAAPIEPHWRYRSTER